MNNKKIIITEFYTWHDECLYSYCKLLKECGYSITLAANSKIKDRITENLSDVTSEIKLFEFSSGFSGFLALIKFLRFIHKSGIKKIHFNTAHGSIALKFSLLPLFKKLEFSGTIHNLNKLKSSFGQKIISRRIKKYTLLNDILAENIKRLTKKESTAIYSIFYPEIKVEDIKKNEGEIWIIIPGAVSFGRRNYNLLFKEENSYPENIKFVILGNINKADGPKLKKMIEEKNLQKSFVIFESFIPNNLFYGYIKKCDYMLPLVSAKDKKLSKYITEKTSGTYNLSIAYKIPMINPDCMKTHEDFTDTSVFFSDGRFTEKLQSLSPEKDKENLFKLQKWTFEEQKERTAKAFEE